MTKHNYALQQTFYLLKLLFVRSNINYINYINYINVQLFSII